MPTFASGIGSPEIAALRDHRSVMVASSGNDKDQPVFSVAKEKLSTIQAATFGFLRFTHRFIEGSYHLADLPTAKRSYKLWVIGPQICSSSLI
ncbi:MAG: hypothetical protein DLM72_17520 [Candidatus Nitrosopolaris wilkensis]|nr:MAG: hypothetical protein DLM72_17520 [Candidatus Nitrosopolaris wilkensis]